MFLARDLSLKRHANTDFQILQPKLVAGAGTASGTRTRVADVKGRCPNQLDDGSTDVIFAHYSWYRQRGSNPHSKGESQGVLVQLDDGGI